VSATEHLVFVYGTLRRGEANHGMLASGETAVTGEVYRVSVTTLKALDVLEDHPRLFCRSVVCLADGTEVEAYLLAPEYMPGRQSITSGDWLLHSRPVASSPAEQTPEQDR